MPGRRQRPQLTSQNLPGLMRNRKLLLGRYTIRMAQQSSAVAGQLAGRPEVSFEEPYSNAGRALTLSTGSTKNYALPPFMPATGWVPTKRRSIT